MRGVVPLLVMGALPALVGCYTPVPIETMTPPVGQTVSFTISDRGRAELSERMGARVSEIEGRVVAVDGEHYVVDVFKVKQFGGASSTWSGETVRLNRGFVERLQGRELSKKKTWLLVGSITVGLAVLIATRDLLGLFSGDRDEPVVDPPETSRRSTAP